MRWGEVRGHLYKFFYIFIFPRKSTYISRVQIEQKIQTAKKIILEIQMIQPSEMSPGIELSNLAIKEV